MNGSDTPSRRFAVYGLLAAGIGSITALGTACQDKKPPEVPAETSGTDVTSSVTSVPTSSIQSSPNTDSDTEKGSSSGKDDVQIEIDGDKESLLAVVGQPVSWKFKITGDGSEDYHIHKINFDPPPAGVEVANNESQNVQIKGTPQTQDPPNGTVEVTACKGTGDTCDKETSDTFDWTFEGMQNGTAGAGSNSGATMKAKVGVAVLKTAVGFLGCITNQMCASGQDGRGGVSGVLTAGLNDFLGSVVGGGYQGNVGNVFGSNQFGQPGFGNQGGGFGFSNTYTSTYSYSSSYSSTYTYTSSYSSTYTYTSSYGYSDTYTYSSSSTYTF